MAYFLGILPLAPAVTASINRLPFTVYAVLLYIYCTEMDHVLHV